MLITIENDDERVTIDTATPAGVTMRATARPGSAASTASGSSPADLDAGSAGFDPMGGGSSGNGVLDGGAYTA